MCSAPQTQQYLIHQISTAYNAVQAASYLFVRSDIMHCLCNLMQFKIVSHSFQAAKWVFYN